MRREFRLDVGFSCKWEFPSRSSRCPRCHPQVTSGVLWTPGQPEPWNSEVVPRLINVKVNEEKKSQKINKNPQAGSIIYLVINYFCPVVWGVKGGRMGHWLGQCPGKGARVVPWLGETWESHSISSWCSEANYNDVIVMNSVIGASHGGGNTLLRCKLNIDRIGSQYGAGIALAAGKSWNWRISCIEGTQNLTFKWVFKTPPAWIKRFVVLLCRWREPGWEHKPSWAIPKDPEEH